MDVTQQRKFIEELMNSRREKNKPDLLQEFRNREEQSRLNQIRQISHNGKWWNL